MRLTDDELFELDMADITQRAGRARDALIRTINALPEAAFLHDPGDGWSGGAIARHAAAVDGHWTLALLRLMEASPGEVIDFGSGEGSFWRELNAEADRGAGITAGSSVPTPFEHAAEALDGLAQARSEFLRTIDSLTPDHFHVRMQRPGPLGAVSLRWLLEHVIEHDWEHTVQIAALPR